VIAWVLVGILALLLVLVWRSDQTRNTERRTSAGSGVFGSFDEVFNPAAARASEIREVQHELTAEHLSSRDPLTSGGTIRIRLRNPAQGERESQ